MTICTNTDEYRRTWLNLVDKATGHTLELGPGESADVDLPADFTDPYLIPHQPPDQPAPPPPPVLPEQPFVSTPVVAESSQGTDTPDEAAPPAVA